MSDVKCIGSYGWKSKIFSLLLLLVFLSACSTSSVLVKTDDPIFKESQQRLQRSVQLVDESKASSEEKALFLQAESFYQYRFEPPERSGAAYLTEMAAAITDFPAFQSLAGSLSLLELRLRSSDGAIQLWETLLVHHPETELRPLTLYKLGWAYRYAGAEGLPHQSSDEVFEQLMKEKPNSKLAALAVEAKQVPWKSKEIATSRSLIPGLGQIYVGDTKSGVIRLSIAALAAAAIIYPITVATQRGQESNNDWSLLALGLGGLITLSIDYTTSYEDAMRGVVQWNERQESEFNRKNLNAP